jgi:hypothetical protein
MAEKWQPFSIRLNGGSIDDTLYEGVPPHLGPALQDWLRDSTDDALLARVVVRLRLKVRDVSSAAELDGSQLLDAVDFVLHAGIRPRYPGLRPKADLLADLAGLLVDGGSAYQLNARRTGLERRVEPTVSEGVRQAVRSAAESPAADHLASAWEAAYGLHPDPSKAYSEAIKAVEAAAQPVIEPNNPKATLGSMLGVLGGAHNAGKWQVTLAGPEGTTDPSVVGAMCRTLWKGQTSRHGSGRPTRHETRAEAEAAVHLSVLLVSWFTTGKVQRRAGHSDRSA